MSESGYSSSLAVPESFQILNDKQQDISIKIDILTKDNVEKTLDKNIGELQTGINERLQKTQGTAKTPAFRTATAISSEFMMGIPVGTRSNAEVVFLIPFGPAITYKIGASINSF